MLLIKTRIGPSKIHGIGIFAAQFIPKDTPTWQFNPALDRAYTEDEVISLPEAAIAAFKNYCYKSATTGRYILCFDDARYFNHAEDANCIEDPTYVFDGETGDIAARDIEEGEELTNNYLSFDADYGYKMAHDIRK